MPEEFKGWSSEIREFQRKLSQIIFAPEPRLELYGMIKSIPGDNGHNQIQDHYKREVKHS